MKIIRVRILLLPFQGFGKFVHPTLQQFTQLNLTIDRGVIATIAAWLKLPREVELAFE